MGGGVVECATPAFAKFNVPAEILLDEIRVDFGGSALRVDFGGSALNSKPQAKLRNQVLSL
jgi:hypothetical protein